MDITAVTLIFSAIALAAALLSVALSFRVTQTVRANAQGVPVPQPRPASVVDDTAGAWHGNTEDGYMRGPFSVRRMPTRGAEAWRGNETEWVAYRDGERAFASPDLEDVLRVCEAAEWTE